MEYVDFGRTGRKVSRLCFGAMGLNFAFGDYSEKELIAAMHQCMERGVNMIDTARHYTGSELIIGRFLKEWSGDPLFIASKVEAAWPETNSGWGIPNPLEVAYPRGAMTEAVEASLRDLQIEQLDLMQLHQYWAQYEAGYWLDELEELKAQGKVAHVGISIPDHRHDQAISIVRSGTIDSVQTIVNVFDPLAFDSLIPICQEYGVAVIARCVLDEGGLTGFLTPDTTFPETEFRSKYFARGPLSEYLRRVEALRSYIPAYADSLAELAIRYVLSHPGVTTATISMHIAEHAEDNICSAAKGPLPDALFSDLRRYHRWLLNLWEETYFPWNERAVAETRR